MSEADQGTRLDKYLSENLDQLSRSKIQNLINDGKVTINGEKEKSSYRLNGNESIVVYVDADDKSTNNHVAQEIPLTIIHEDDDIMIITNQGVMIRQKVAAINTIGRNTQGVRLLKLDDKATISSITKVLKEEEEDSENSEADDAVTEVSEE